MMSFIKDLNAYRALRGMVRRRFRPLFTNPFLHFMPPGHFYSPIPDSRWINQHRARLFNRNAREVPGVEINQAGQLDVLASFAPFSGELPFGAGKRGSLRYHYENAYFGYGDGAILYAMLRRFKPARVVEVGSGFSSAVMLDTDELFLGRTTQFTFVEPYPERLLSLIRPADRQRHDVLVAPVQEVPLERFKALEKNDMLFVDSSHVVKIGSDVVHLLSEVLPVLKPGVVVHFHDVLWPFEYPEEWIDEGRGWTEAYMLKAFLQFNSAFEILFFNSYMARHHGREVEQHFPGFLRAPGGSLWLRKLA